MIPQCTDEGLALVLNALDGGPGDTAIIGKLMPPRENSICAVILEACVIGAIRRAHKQDEEFATSLLHSWKRLSPKQKAYVIGTTSSCTFADSDRMRSNLLGKYGDIVYAHVGDELAGQSTIVRRSEKPTFTQAEAAELADIKKMMSRVEDIDYEDLSRDDQVLFNKFRDRYLELTDPSRWKVEEIERSERTPWDVWQAVGIDEPVIIYNGNHHHIGVGTKVGHIHLRERDGAGITHVGEKSLKRVVSPVAP